jgi:hypothetical protein
MERGATHSRKEEKVSTQSAVQQQLGMWHGVVDGMVSQCGDTLNKNIDGATITSIASVYAHIVFAEDFIVNGMLQGKTPIFHQDGWGDKLGIAPADPTNPAMQPEWGRSVKMDLPKFQEYAKQVFANTDAYLSSVQESDLQQKAQTPIGEQTKEWVVAVLLGTHLPQHTGEIAALMGVQGMKGLPF